MLVGTAFLCLCLLNGLSAAQPQPDVSDPLSRAKEFHSDFVGHRLDSRMGQLDLAGRTISFPWSSRRVSGFEPHREDFLPRSAPVREEIPLHGSD